MDDLNAPTQAKAPTSDIAPAETGPKWKGWLKELAETVVLALLIFLVLRLLVQNFRIEGHSMEPNLHDGQFLIVDKISYRLHDPQRGDVIVFRSPSTPGKDFIKRVIGLPGEKVEIREGVVWVDDKAVAEPYVTYHGGRSWGPQRVKAGELFVLGDNRPSSNDSRQWGMLPRDKVIGKAWLSYWPPQEWGFVPHVSHAGNR